MRRHLILALSLANLCFFSAWREVLSPQGLSYLYYWKQYPGYAALAALVINVLLLSFVFVVGFKLASRWGGKTGLTLAQVIFLLVFLRALNNIRAQFDSLSTTHLRVVIGRAGYIAVFALVGLLIAFALWRYGLTRVARGAALIVLIWSPFGLVGLGQATWLAVKYGRAISRERPLASALGSDNKARPRVVWLIFDEMDQQLAFANRPAGLSLPEFDRLRAQALFASNAFPPAGHTSQSIPALLTGKLIAAVRPAGPGELALTFPHQAEPAGWSTQPDVFSEVRARGFNTALVGWYHPYCRVIGDRLTQCFWEAASQRLDPSKLSLKKNLIRQDADVLRLLPLTAGLRARLSPASARDYRSEHLADYTNLMRQAEDVVARKEFGLVFLHLPVPHPPYIYNRDKRVFDTTEESNYLDNLALTDRALGDLRRKMEQTGTWENTTIVISSDHWWRSDYWRGRTSFWSAADQLARGEQLDHRVPFIVKLANQKTALPYDAAFNTVLTHDLVLEILNGKISSAEQVSAWIDSQRTFGESPYQTYEDPE